MITFEQLTPVQQRMTTPEFRTESDTIDAHVLYDMMVTAFAKAGVYHEHVIAQVRSLIVSRLEPRDHDIFLAFLNAAEESAS